MPATLEEALRAASTNGLPCAEAFKIAGELKISRRKVGDMATQLKIRITDCQLGCFQWAKATHEDLKTLSVNSTLVNEIAASLSNGQLACPAAFKIARKFKLTPKAVGDATTKQKVRIVSCQLGCF